MSKGKGPAPDLEARIAAIEATEAEARTLARYGVLTAEQRAFYLAEAERDKRLKEKRARAYERSKAEAARTDAMLRRLAGALLESGALSIHVDGARVLTTDPDAIPCPHCKAASKNGAGYLLALVETWRATPDPHTLIGPMPGVGTMGYPIVCEGLICQACRKPMTLVIQLAYLGPAEDPRRTAEWRAYLKDLEIDREAEAEFMAAAGRGE